LLTRHYFLKAGSILLFRRHLPESLSSVMEDSLDNEWVQSDVQFELWRGALFAQLVSVP
jgi:hypothetical protein